MSMFGDYKSYKKYAPEYKNWKEIRNLAETKRLKYLQQNTSEINPQDIQRSKTLLRAIDVMDEYSQKNAENMEVIAESVINMGLEFAMFVGMGIGLLATKTKPIKKLLNKYIKNNTQGSRILTIGTMLVGGAIGTIAGLPLYAWGAKAEVKASRKGRFEAMRTELKDPKTFAVLTPEQEEQLNINLKNLATIKDKKKPFGKLNENIKALKEMATDSNEYLLQRMEIEKQLEENEKHYDKELTKEEIETAKKDQQLLTKLVEKIDLASQDYAENAELATGTLIASGFSLGALVSLGYEKLAKKLKWKKSSVPAGAGFILALAASIAAASIQKQAARVGRYKIKQELMKNPSQLVYVSDEKTGEITDVEIKPQEKTGIFKFLKEAWKNNKEFEKWKKTEGAKEKNLSKAMESVELSEEQMKDAKRLQHNTFKTFNKVDENSQKYAESLEALGQTIQYPVNLIFSIIGMFLGFKHLDKLSGAKTVKESLKPIFEYTSIILLSTVPSILINAFITKEQKKASRVADMLAIDEMKDYRFFADYSRFKTKES